MNKHLYFSQGTTLFSKKWYFKLVCHIYTSKCVKHNEENYKVFLMWHLKFKERSLLPCYSKICMYVKTSLNSNKQIINTRKQNPIYHKDLRGHRNKELEKRNFLSCSLIHVLTLWCKNKYFEGTLEKKNHFFFSSHKIATSIQSDAGQYHI